MSSDSLQRTKGLSPLLTPNPKDTLEGHLSHHRPIYKAYQGDLEGLKGDNSGDILPSPNTQGAQHCVSASQGDSLSPKPPSYMDQHTGCPSLPPKGELLA